MRNLNDISLFRRVINYHNATIQGLHKLQPRYDIDKTRSLSPLLYINFYISRYDYIYSYTDAKSCYHCFGNANDLKLLNHNNYFKLCFTFIF